MTWVTAHLIGPSAKIHESFKTHVGYELPRHGVENFEEPWSTELVSWLRTIAGPLLTQPTSVCFDGYPEFWIGAGATQAEIASIDTLIKDLQARRDRLATTLAATSPNAA